MLSIEKIWSISRQFSVRNRWQSRWQSSNGIELIKQSIMCWKSTSKWDCVFCSLNEMGEVILRCHSNAVTIFHVRTVRIDRPAATIMNINSIKVSWFHYEFMSTNNLVKIDDRMCVWQLKRPSSPDKCVAFALCWIQSCCRMLTVAHSHPRCAVASMW